MNSAVIWTETDKWDSGTPQENFDLTREQDLSGDRGYQIVEGTFAAESALFSHP